MFEIQIKIADHEHWRTWRQAEPFEKRNDAQSKCDELEIEGQLVESAFRVMEIETVKEYVTSAAQLTTARQCMRKWAWKYIAGIDEPPSQPLELGKKVHSILEAYLKDGTVPDPNETWRFKPGARLFYVGKIALTMFSAIMPKPGTGTVEGGLTMTISGVKLRGFIDHWNFDPTAGEEGRITIIDHKTSSDPEKWGKTPETLLDDVQPIVYARMLLERHPGADVTCFWNYGSTDAVQRKAKVVGIDMSPGAVYAKFENDVVPLARVLRSHVEAKTDPLSLPPNPDICDMFGGCPHRSRCNLSTKDRIGAFVMAGSSLIDSLLATNPGAAAPALPPPAAATAPALPAPAAGDVVNPPEAAAPPPPLPATPPVTPAAAPAPAAPDINALLGAAPLQAAAPPAAPFRAAIPPAEAVTPPIDSTAAADRITEGQASQFVEAVATKVAAILAKRLQG